MHRIFEDFRAIAESRKLHVRTFMETIKGRTTNFSSDGFIRSTLEKITAESDVAGETVNNLNKHLVVNKKPLDRFLRAIFITNMQGRVVASTDEKLIGMDMSDCEEFEHGVHCGYGVACVSKPHYSPHLDANGLFVSSAVLDIIGVKTIGVLVNVYNLDCLGEVTASRAGIGETGEVYLVNRDKLMITASRFIKHAPLKLTVDTQPVRAFLEDNKEITGIYRDYKDVSVAGVSMIIPEYDWVLLAEVHESEAFAPTKTLYTIAFILGGICSIVVIAGGMVFSTSASRRIRELTHATERFAGGDTEYRVRAASNDEIGILANGFNAMLEEISRKIRELKAAEDETKREKEKYKSLIGNIPDAVYSSLPDETRTAIFISDKWADWTGYTPEEFYHNPETLMKSVHPEDKDYAMNLYRKAIKKRHDYILEYRVINKNTGRVFFLRDHGIPVKDEEGNIIRYDGIATDITERKALEKTLEENRQRLQSIMDNTTSVVYMKDMNGKYLYVNRQFEMLFNITRERITGKTDYEFFPRETADAFRKNDIKVMETKSTQEFEETAQRADGLHTYLSIKFPLYDEKGAIYAVCGISTDITERKRMENMLWKTSQSMRSLVQMSPLAIVVRSTEGRVKEWNQAAERIFGWSANEVVGRTMPAMPEYPSEEWRSIIESELAAGTRNALELRRLKKDGSYVDISLWTSHIHDASGMVVDILCIYADITERRKVEEELRKLSVVIAQSVNIIFITNIKGEIEYVNPMFEQVTGYTKEEITGQNASILASGEMTDEEYKQLWESILSGKTWRGVFKNKKKNGQYFWGNGLISPICNRDGKITNFLAIQEDVTEKMEAKEHAKYLANYDALTGLLNRTSFIEVLNDWLYETKIHHYPGVILLIDIDKFRHFNDAYGNMIGDTILKRTARALENILTGIDTEYCKTTEKDREIMDSLLGRLGGDEYAIFLPSRNEEAGIRSAEEIRKRVEMCWFEEVNGHITVSIGVALYPAHGITINELFSRADAAVYRAKELGQNQVRLYHPDDKVLEKMHYRIAWKQRILKTIQEDRFAPWFQPILDLSDNIVHHYEALARMYSENGNIILPSSFVETAEAFGLITALDRIIIGKAMQYQMELKKQGRSLSFSINLSGKEIGEKGLLEFLKEKLSETGVNPAQFIIEITETAAVMDFDKAIGFVNDLRAIGCKFSLDDFGVGFTSFKYLKKMQVDYIKIDGSFIRNLQGNQHDRLFVKSIADVAKGMEIKTIAEFVENEETVNILRELGVNYAQGYFVGKPTPGVKMEG